LLSQTSRSIQARICDPVIPSGQSRGSFTVCFPLFTKIKQVSTVILHLVFFLRMTEILFNHFMHVVGCVLKQATPYYSYFSKLYHVHYIIYELGELSRYSDWLRAGQPGGGSLSPGRVKKFSLLHIVQTGSRFHPTSYKMDTGGSFPGVKRQGREVDHSPPTSAEVKKMWNYTSTPLCVFMA
jgi:hypothetical protein